jgi:hypothetical protein
VVMASKSIPDRHHIGSGITRSITGGMQLGLEH